MLDEESTIWSYLLCSFLLHSFSSSSLGWHILLCSLCSNTVSLWLPVGESPSFTPIQNRLFKRPGKFSMKLVHNLVLKYPWLFWKRCILSDLHSLNRKSPLADVCSQALERHLEMTLDADHRCLSSSGSESSLPPLSTVQVCTVKCWCWKINNW